MRDTEAFEGAEHTLRRHGSCNAPANVPPKLAAKKPKA